MTGKSAPCKRARFLARHAVAFIEPQPKLGILMCAATMEASACGSGSRSCISQLAALTTELTPSATAG